MRFWWVAFLLAGCASSAPKKTQIYNRACEPTPLTLSDMKPFNITPVPGKVTVVRVMRSTCPYCKEDLQQIALMFRTGKWTSDKIQLVLVAYKKEGLESRESFDGFVRSKLPAMGFPLEAAQIIFLDKSYPDLLKAKGRSGDLIFADWRAVPYSLVFAKDGRLAYRGHFTMIPSQQDKHYDYITELQNETCKTAGL